MYDQGWFQYSYLLHLQQHYNRTLWFDCASDFKDIPELSLIKSNGLRNNCYAKNWYFYDLWGKYLSKQHKPIKHHNDPVEGCHYCMLQGSTTEDRFNIHDCNGKQKFDSSTGEFLFFPDVGVMSINYSEPVVDRCRLQGTLLYHGKDFRTLENRVRPNWTKMTERAQVLMNQSKSVTEVTVLHLFPIMEDVRLYKSCNETWQLMLHADAVRNEWMPPQWKKIQTDFFAEIGFTQ